MSVTQPSMWNVVSLHPQDPQGQGQEFNFIIGPNTRTMPDNQAGFRTYSTTYTEAPSASFLSTASEMRLPVMEPMNMDEYQTFFNDRVPYQKGAYAPPGAPPLFGWPTESHGLPIAGPFDDSAIHLVDTAGQVVDTWPFLPPGIAPANGQRGRTYTADEQARGVNRTDRIIQRRGEERMDDPRDPPAPPAGAPPAAGPPDPGMPGPFPGGGHEGDGGGRIDLPPGLGHLGGGFGEEYEYGGAHPVIVANPFFNMVEEEEKEPPARPQRAQEIRDLLERMDLEGHDFRDLPPPPPPPPEQEGWGGEFEEDEPQIDPDYLAQAAVGMAAYQEGLMQEDQKEAEVAAAMDVDAIQGGDVHDEQKVPQANDNPPVQPAAAQQLPDEVRAADEPDQEDIDLEQLLEEADAILAEDDGRAPPADPFQQANAPSNLSNPSNTPVAPIGGAQGPPPEQVQVAKQLADESVDGEFKNMSDPASASVGVSKASDPSVLYAAMGGLKGIGKSLYHGAKSLASRRGASKALNVETPEPASNVPTPSSKSTTPTSARQKIGARLGFGSSPSKPKSVQEPSASSSKTQGGKSLAQLMAENPEPLEVGLPNPMEARAEMNAMIEAQDKTKKLLEAENKEAAQSAPNAAVITSSAVLYTQNPDSKQPASVLITPARKQAYLNPDNPYQEATFRYLDYYRTVPISTSWKEPRVTVWDPVFGGPLEMTTDVTGNVTANAYLQTFDAFGHPYGTPGWVPIGNVYIPGHTETEEERLYRIGGGDTFQLESNAVLKGRVQNFERMLGKPSGYYAGVRSAYQYQLEEEAKARKASGMRQFHTSGKYSMREPQFTRMESSRGETFTPKNTIPWDIALGPQGERQFMDPMHRQQYESSQEIAASLALKTSKMSDEEKAYSGISDRVRSLQIKQQMGAKGLTQDEIAELSSLKSMQTMYGRKVATITAARQTPTLPSSESAIEQKDIVTDGASAPAVSAGTDGTLMYNVPPPIPRIEAQSILKESFGQPVSYAFQKPPLTMTVGRKYVRDRFLESLEIPKDGKERAAQAIAAARILADEHPKDRTYRKASDLEKKDAQSYLDALEVFDSIQREVISDKVAGNWDPSQQRYITTTVTDRYMARLVEHQSSANSQLYDVSRHRAMLLDNYARLLPFFIGQDVDTGGAHMAQGIITSSMGDRISYIQGYAASLTELMYAYAEGGRNPENVAKIAEMTSLFNSAMQSAFRDSSMEEKQLAEIYPTVGDMQTALAQHRFINDAIAAAQLSFINLERDFMAAYGVAALTGIIASTTLDETTKLRYRDMLKDATVEGFSLFQAAVHSINQNGIDAEDISWELSPEQQKSGEVGREHMEQAYEMLGYVRDEQKERFQSEQGRRSMYEMWGDPYLANTTHENRVKNIRTVNEVGLASYPKILIGGQLPNYRTSIYNMDRGRWAFVADESKWPAMFTNTPNNDTPILVPSLVSSGLAKSRKRSSARVQMDLARGARGIYEDVNVPYATAEKKKKMKVPTDAAYGRFEISRKAPKSQKK